MNFKKMRQPFFEHLTGHTIYVRVVIHQTQVYLRVRTKVHGLAVQGGHVGVLHHLIKEEYK